MKIINFRELIFNKDVFEHAYIYTRTLNMTSYVSDLRIKLKSEEWVASFETEEEAIKAREELYNLLAKD